MTNLPQLSREPIVQRHPNNPILTKHDIPYPVATVHNAGVCKLGNRYIMLFRSHQRDGRSVIGRAVSDDGFAFVADSTPFLTPATTGIFAEYEEFGVEDLRISPCEGEFLLTYSAYSRHGVRIALARTTDFESFERISLISQPDMRNVVIFPRRIDGRYVRLDRPHSEISAWSIHVSYSPDLVHWGDSRVAMKGLPYHWDEMKIGPGAPPFETDKGWLHIYHGVFQTMAGAVYRLGAALHALDDPSQVIGVANDWILEPEDPWERVGYVPNVVFTCGTVPEPDGTVKIYWGAADTVMCAGVASIDKLLDLCINHSRNPR